MLFLFSLVEPCPEVRIGGDDAADDEDGRHDVDPVPARAVRLLVLGRKATEVESVEMRVVWRRSRERRDDDDDERRDEQDSREVEVLDERGLRRRTPDRVCGELRHAENKAELKNSSVTILNS